MTRAILTHGDGARCPDVKSGRAARCTGHEVRGAEADGRVVDLARTRRLALAVMNLDVAADLLAGAGEGALAEQVRELWRRASDLYRP